ncbi:MAG: MFS transporter [Parachlamydia sp.]|nr:MFS transporter [Parachlamydia sp.]
MDKTSTSRSFALIVWFITSIFYSYQYVLRVIPNIFLDDIMQQFDMGAGVFGQFSGIYYIGYSLMHLPIGLMLDRFGPKKVMSGCILLSVAGLMPLLFSDYWIYPIAGRFLIGVGSSAAILGVFKIVRMVFDEKKFPRMLSLSVTIGLIGAIYGGGPISYMRDVFGYQAVVQILALAGLGLAAATFLIIPDFKEESRGSIASDLKEVLLNGRVLCCCFFAGLMVGPMEGFADVWGSIFLKNVYGIEKTVAASLTSFIFVGMCFGSPALSYIADKMGSYLAAIIGAGAVMAASFAFLLLWPLNYQMISIDFALIGVCCAYQILAIYKASNYVRSQAAGLATALANMIIMLFGYAFHTTMGGIINAMGGPTDPQALLLGIAVIPVSLCLGTAGFIGLMIWERNPQNAGLPATG